MTNHPTDRPSPYPLLFEPILMEKVWGGRRLAALDKKLPPNQLVGESWEIADLASTNPSGAGGMPAHSIIRNGPLTGQTIGDAMTQWEGDLLGQARPTSTGAFPLLVKFLDAQQNLSVQTHPSPQYSRTHPDAHLKHEAWCIIDSTPQGRIYRGLKTGVRRADLIRLIDQGAVVEALESIPATPGLIVHLPSGVIHALGAGVLVAEIQTPSDTTYRLDDWGRTGRSLHIDQALDGAFDDSGAPTVPFSQLPPPSDQYVGTDAFSITRIQQRAGTEHRLANDAQSPTILMCLVGAVTLQFAGGESITLDLVCGDTALAPAVLSSGAIEFTQDATLLIVTLPTH